MHVYSYSLTLSSSILHHRKGSNVQCTVVAFFLFCTFSPCSRSWKYDIPGAARATCPFRPRGFLPILYFIIILGNKARARAHTHKDIYAPTRGKDVTTRISFIRWYSRRSRQNLPYFRVSEV